MSLNMSYYSEFNENWQSNFEQLETLVEKYNQLDDQMYEFYKTHEQVSKQSSFMGKIIFENDSQENKLKS